VTGDTGGALLVMEDVTISRGGRDLMSGVHWRLLPGDRIALVGPNGAGKSTLLAAAAQRIPVMGKNIMAAGMRMGYLVQTAVSGSTKTAWEEAASQMHRLNAAQAELDQATADITAGDTSDVALNRLADAQAAFEAAGGYNVEEKVASVLTGLGFAQEDFHKSCTEFSGGWQMKIALARLLLSEPDMLMLDEPTNHLDAAAKAWLGGYVSGYEGTVVLVTHEESLLDRAALTGVIEVRDEQAHVFRGDYRKFLVEREQRVLRAQSEYEQQQREIAALEEYITRFGAKASHAASAQSKQKALDKIVRLPEPKTLAAPSAAPTLRFPPPQFLEMEALRLSQASWGWNDSPLYTGVDLTIERGVRLAVLGPNGCGKSTLLAALTGKLPLLTGERVEADSLQMGVFTQDLAQELDLEQVALDHVLQTVQVHSPIQNGPAPQPAAVTNEFCKQVLARVSLHSKL
jgi:ATP-binding cassette subfamily F protein 3